MDRWHHSSGHALSSTCLCSRLLPLWGWNSGIWSWLIALINIIKLWVGTVVSEQLSLPGELSLRPMKSWCSVSWPRQWSPWVINVPGGVVRIQAGDIEIQTQLGTRSLIHSERPIPAPSSDCNTFLRRFCPSAHASCHCPFLAELRAFRQSALRLAQRELEEIGYLLCISCFCPQGLCFYFFSTQSSHSVIQLWYIL